MGPTSAGAQAASGDPGVTRPWPGATQSMSIASTMASAEQLARRIATLSARDQSITTGALRLAERIAGRRFHIAVAGEFKRGKSTLVNALLGRALLPTGVVPLTAVATEVHFGSKIGTVVVYGDGRREPVAETDLAEYVAEAANPGNRRGVQRVELYVEPGAGGGWAESGLVLVDTPGFASVHEHQTAAATAALAEADGAVVVLSVDSPLSHGERSLLATLADRQAALFVVVNKCDHLDAAELADVRTYLDGQVRGLIGEEARMFYVAARTALDAGMATASAGDPSVPALEPGFAEFRRALSFFVREDLASARTAAALCELSRLARSLEASSSIEAAAVALGRDRLEQVLVLCQEAVEEGRRRFAEDRLVADHEVDRLSNQVGQLLADGAAGAIGAAWKLVETAAVDASHRELLDRLDDAIVEAVEREMEPVRRAAQAVVERGWSELATRFESRFWDRIDSLRARAGELLEVAVTVVPMPLIGSEPDRFSYSFVRVESPGTAVGRIIRALFPIPAIRRRMIQRARDQVRRDLEKHAGRARYDLVERLHGAEQRFLAIMTAELNETEHSILDGIERARALIGEGESGRLSAERARASASLLARQAAALADGGGRPLTSDPAELAPGSAAIVRVETDDDSPRRAGSAGDTRGCVDPIGVGGLPPSSGEQRHPFGSTQAHRGHRQPPWLERR